MVSTLDPSYIATWWRAKRTSRPRRCAASRPRSPSAEREHAEEATHGEEADAAERRAEKAEYLKQKLEERAAAEREAAGEDEDRITPSLQRRAELAAHLAAVEVALAGEPAHPRSA